LLRNIICGCAPLKHLSSGGGGGEGREGAGKESFSDEFSFLNGKLKIIPN